MTDLELLNRILVQFKIRAGSPRDSKGRVVSIGGGSLGGAKAATTAGSGVITRQDLQEAIGDKGFTEMTASLRGLVHKMMTGPTTTGGFHGMSHPETFHSFEFEGVKFHFAKPQHDEHLSMAAVTGTLQFLNAAPPIPKEISQHTKNVYLTAQKNAGDAHWAKAYNMPGFVSGATGGDGNIVVYKNNMLHGDTLAHEMGHNFAQASFGDTTPPPISPYRKAIASGEPPVSAYAGNSHSEDFAEAVKMYVGDRERLQQIAPRRYQVLKRMIDAHTTDFP